MAKARSIHVDGCASKRLARRLFLCTALAMDHVAVCFEHSFADELALADFSSHAQGGREVGCNALELLALSLGDRLRLGKRSRERASTAGRIDGVETEHVGKLVRFLRDGHDARAVQRRNRL